MEVSPIEINVTRRTRITSEVVKIFAGKAAPAYTMAKCNHPPDSESEWNRQQ